MIKEATFYQNWGKFKSLGLQQFRHFLGRTWIKRWLCCFTVTKKNYYFIFIAFVIDDKLNKITKSLVNISLNIEKNEDYCFYHYGNYELSKIVYTISLLLLLPNKLHSKNMWLKFCTSCWCLILTYAILESWFLKTVMVPFKFSLLSEDFCFHFYVIVKLPSFNSIWAVIRIKMIQKQPPELLYEKRRS